MENKDPREIAFIFKDVSCTIPANKELAEWLKYMLENHQQDLHFLYKESQAYVSFGGGSGYSKQRWFNRLTKNVNKHLEEFNNRG